MALIDIWRKSPEQVTSKRLQQIIGFAGSGKLKDDNDASHEFRTFLAHVPSTLLAHYADECLSDKFDDSGLAPQDIVNQMGRRLGFSVTDGRYRGTSTHVGFDGIWQSPGSHNLIVEVKTTDAYRIDLNAIAGYRRSLMASGRLKEDESSILIVVGRQDTGDVEAQIRGSHHAWDVRLISLGALSRLMKLKEEVEDPAIIAKIYDILRPGEFTKVDGIIDLVFSTAEEVGQETEEVEEDEGVRKPKFVPVTFHDACIKRIQRHLQATLIRRSRATYAAPDSSLAVICMVSREHPAPGGAFYWFAFHPYQRDALGGTPRSYVAFGCGSEAKLLLIPFEKFRSWLDDLNITKKDARFYWHVHIHEQESRYALHRKQGKARLDVTEYLLPTGSR